jgi:hypothetical protein
MGREKLPNTLSASRYCNQFPIGLQWKIDKIIDFQYYVSHFIFATANQFFDPCVIMAAISFLSFKQPQITHAEGNASKRQFAMLKKIIFSLTSEANVAQSRRTSAISFIFDAISLIFQDLNRNNFLNIHVHDTSRWGAKSLRLRSRASPCCFVTYLFC